MSIETIQVSPEASISIVRAGRMYHAELFCSGSYTARGLGADRNAALQDLEQQLQRLADAVSATFTHEVCTDA